MREPSQRWPGQCLDHVPDTYQPQYLGGSHPSLVPPHQSRPTAVQSGVKHEGESFQSFKVGLRIDFRCSSVNLVLRNTCWREGVGSQRQRHAPTWEIQLGTVSMGVLGASFHLNSPPWCKETLMKRFGQDARHFELEQNEIAAIEPLTISAPGSLLSLFVGFEFPPHCVHLQFVGKTCWTRGYHLRKSTSHRQALWRKQIRIRENIS